ncbi:MAG: hypothetical protein ACI4BD_06400 [Paludibacteraceae bacterium]
MKLSEQVNTVERALGERMITHAMVIVRQWATELGDEILTNRIDQLEQNYRYVFDYYLSTEDPDREALLDKMTGEAYRITDEVYAALRIKRGMSPDMHGFNPGNPQSVMHYFSSCVQLQPEDLQWLQQAAQYEHSSAIAIAASAALAQNLRECFNEAAMLTLIDVANSDNGLVADQALANLILLLAHYDVRIDFFPNIQDAFMEPLGDGTRAFETMGAIIRSTKMNLRDVLASGQLSFEDLPDALKDLLGSTGETPDIESIQSWMPASENEYMAGITAILPDTWVYAVIVGDSPEREEKIALIYLSVGKMDMLWDNLDMAEGWLTQRLCSEQAAPIDYINYGHCCFVRGDRMLAYENYREARSKCKSAKEFFALFRPDRHFLLEKGIPVEQIYLMEDQLLRA